MRVPWLTGTELPLLELELELELELKLELELELGAEGYTVDGS
jgi:hypothetical protein